MSMKTELENLSKVPETRPPSGSFAPPDPSKFAIGIAVQIVKMMLSITFDPLKGISIPGAENFLTQTTGFVGINAPPAIRQLSSLFDDENIPILEALVNAGGQDTKYTFEVNENNNFTRNSLIFTGALNNVEDTKISAVVYGKINFSQKYFYRLKLENKNGTATSDIFIFLTKGAPIATNPPEKGGMNA